MDAENCDYGFFCDLENIENEKNQIIEKYDKYEMKNNDIDKKKIITYKNFYLPSRILYSLYTKNCPSIQPLNNSDKIIQYYMMPLTITSTALLIYILICHPH